MPPAKKPAKNRPRAPRKKAVKTAKLSATLSTPAAAKIAALPEPKAPAVPKPVTLVESEGKETARPSKRTPVTLETYLAQIRVGRKKCDDEIEKLQQNPSGDRKGIKTLKSLRRVFQLLEKQAPKLSKGKRRRATPGGGKNSGLTTPKPITAEFRSFLKLPTNKEISRIEGTRALNAYIHIKPEETREDVLAWAYLNPNYKDGGRNLQNSDDRRVIVPDVRLSTLLRYNQYKKDVAAGKVTESRKNKVTGVKEVVIIDDNALHYRTIQKLIQIHFP